MMTRRNILKTGIAALTVPYIGRSEPRRSMLGAVDTGEEGSSEWVNPYVTDGLLSMWDGEWNAGGGLHDENSLIWKDLVGSRDWQLGSYSSYEWKNNSFYAKDQNAATQDFIDGSIVKTVEVCATLQKHDQPPIGNFAFIILGRLTTNSKPYYGILYRNPSGAYKALMSGFSFYTNTYTEFVGTPSSFSFPDFDVQNVVPAFFNGVSRDANTINTLDYNANTRGTTARIGGTLTQAMPIEVFNLRIYSRPLSEDEIFHNYTVDRERFNLP